MQFPTAIEVIDPAASALVMSRTRFEEMPSNQNIVKIDFFSSISNISPEIDLAIVATNADVRAGVIRNIVQNTDISFLILEKVLFQKPADYSEIQDLLKSKNIKTWINHPRRTFPFYQHVKSILAECQQVSCHFQGGAWGLGCNGLHMIDLLAFLTNTEKLTIENERLNKAIIQSKRVGYIELSGSLAGNIGNHSFELYCHEKPSPVTITICSDLLNAVIDEAAGWVRMATASYFSPHGEVTYPEKRQYRYQSRRY